ncbi:MAG: PAS domain-containing methyl-accepting chemotaxis protein, partial [Xanthomonadaceae bacterium]|nr:PAS domain-containing methyl-accepting chemotaxis protein [Xanthomonadaceae bacterium]
MTTTLYSLFDRLHGLRFERLHKLQQAWQEQRAQRDLLGRVAAIDQVQAVIEFAPDGTILAANDNFLRCFGYSREQVVGQHHRIFVDPAERDGETYQEFWRQLGEGQHRSGVFRRVDANGNEVWIQGSYSPIRDRFGRVHRVVKHATDITEQRLATADMEGRLAAIDRAQAVITFDLDGIVQEANDNFLATMGYRRDEVIGQHHRMFVEKQERESAAYREFWQRLHDGEYNAGLYRRVHRDGSPVWLQASYNPILDASGRPHKVVKLATDVTRQTLAAQALRRSVEELNATVPVIAGEAQTADKLASEANDSANAGNALVERLVADIADISQHSRDMGEIISVMNSIAFQTNILSLNA